MSPITEAREGGSVDSVDGVDVNEGLSAGGEGKGAETLDVPKIQLGSKKGEGQVNGIDEGSDEDDESVNGLHEEEESKSKRKIGSKKNAGTSRENLLDDRE